MPTVVYASADSLLNFAIKRRDLRLQRLRTYANCSEQTQYGDK
jgi:hypothetical protein